MTSDIVALHSYLQTGVPLKKIQEWLCLRGSISKANGKILRIDKMHKIMGESLFLFFPKFMERTAGFRVYFGKRQKKRKSANPQGY